MAENTTLGQATLTTYLIDPANHTGYAQVVEEIEYDDDGSGGWTPSKRIQYTLGDDVLAQSTSTYSGGWSASNPQYLLYDGHGSTRQLANASGLPQDSYSYDGYGVMLSGAGQSGAEAASNAATNLLYTGEQYDADAQQYYLRARYYNPANGLFNRVDPYAGNMQDPQSLHKYTYCHNNPVNAIDPTGKFITSVISILDAMIIRMQTFVMATPVLLKTLTIMTGLLALFNLYVLATDPEAVDFFVASCGGDLTMASGILAMDVMAIRNMAVTFRGMFAPAAAVGAGTKNIIKIKWKGKGSLRDFWRKAKRLQESARNGGLIYVGAGKSEQLRNEGAAAAQAAYRKAVQNRLIRWCKHKGMNDQQAAGKAAKMMQRLQADHSIDLQVSGALDNPNSYDNMHMLDSSINGSVGSQIQHECSRLGLGPGDSIDDIIIDAPTCP